MAYENNHYVPQFILRRFGDKLNRYNVKTEEIKVKGSIINSFSAKNIYPEWLEHSLANLESRIANLIDNKILNVENNVTLTREDSWLIKKFFTVAMLRVPDSSLNVNKHLDSEESLIKRGFKETKIENESVEDYSYRTLKVILESNNLDDVYKHPEVTYEACNWMTLFACCYLTIWDSKKVKEDFIITDCGMNCEHDKSRFKTYNFNGKLYTNNIEEMIKNGYVYKKFKDFTGNNKELLYHNLICNMQYVHANYYLFAVSNDRTVSLINPFYRLYNDETYLKITNEKPDVWPTLLSKEAMSCNTQTYIELGKSNSNDLFHYKVKDLSLNEVIIVNCMMLDRVYKWFGFDSSFKISRSLNVYSMIPKQFQRNSYEKLIDYLYSLGCEFPKIKKYQDICDELINTDITNEEMKYIKYFYDYIISKNNV